MTKKKSKKKVSDIKTAQEKVAEVKEAVAALSSSDASSYAEAQNSVEHTFFQLLGSSNSSTTPVAADVAGGGGNVMEGSTTSAQVSGSGQIADFLSVAANEIGNGEEGGHDRTKYGEYCGNSGQPWCSEFVAWCGHAAGVGDIVGKITYAAGYITAKGYKSSTTEPHAGDVIAWTGGRRHACILAGVVGEGKNWSRIYTIEGNQGTKVKQRTYTPQTVNKKGTAHFCTPPWTNPGTATYTPRTQKKS